MLFPDNSIKILVFKKPFYLTTCPISKSGNLGFYLQDAYVKDWIDNTMVFMEVEDVQGCYQDLLALQLPTKYPSVRLSPVRQQEWGSECYLHDPSGILWHFGAFHDAK